MRTVWNRLTLMKYVQPGDDYELTPRRLLAGIGGFVLFMFLPSIMGAVSRLV